LENVEEVVIRSFNSDRRSRDGPGAQWRSYGATTVERVTDRRMLMDHYHINDSGAIHFPHLLFNSLLDALGAAGSRPKGIEIMGKGAPPLTDDAFALNPAIRPSVPSMLLGLEKLHLHVEIITRIERVITAPSPGSSHTRPISRIFASTVHGALDSRPSLRGWASQCLMQIPARHPNPAMTDGQLP